MSLSSVNSQKKFYMNDVKLAEYFIFNWYIKKRYLALFSSVQFSSVIQSCPTLCNPMDCSMPGLYVHHQLPEFTQTHIHIWLLKSHSVQFSRSVMSDSLWPHGLQHTRPPCPSPTPGVHPNLCPLSRWCHPTISSSVVPFSSCPQSFPASGSFPMGQFFASHGQVLEFQLQHQSFQSIFRTDFL